MDFRPNNFPERYKLFPQADKLANLVLKKLGYMTSIEQHVARTRALCSMSYSIAKPITQMSQKNIANANFQAEQQARYTGDPFRDLEQLQSGGVDIIKTLTEVKQTYNELVKVCIERSPRFMDLVWQVYRRTHRLEVEYQELEDIFNPSEDRKKDNDPAMLPTPTTDGERVKRYQFNLRCTPNSPFLQTEPNRRVVEFDPSYFYGTGRFAFANQNGDIFQTAWDENQKEFPLFKLN